MRERDVFLAALDYDRPDERAAYLDQACAGDPVLRGRVEALFRFDGAVGNFLSEPALHRVAGVAGPADGPASDLPPDLLAPPGRPGSLGRVGQFDLLETVGRGGMGVVYRAWDAHLDRDVAVKFLQGRAAADPSAARRFRHEARVTARLQHPGVPPVHEVGELPDGRPFLAMKLVAGRTLADLLGDRPDPAHDRGRLVAAFEAVCQAVGYAHSRGVIHRDLKPANVMVGAFGEVQVMDWGLAKDLADAPAEPASGDAPAAPDRGPPSDGPPDERPTAEFIPVGGATPPGGEGDPTRAGVILGTPGYMAPEQARGAATDRRSDVYGLGAVLCTILTGAPPFDGATTADTLRANAAGDPAAARARLAQCGADPELVAVCEQCLSPRPADRPADAGAVAAAVAAWWSRAEERARRAEVDRAEAAVRVGELRKRRRVWLGLAAVSVVGFGVAVGLALWADAARRAAETARGKEAEARAKSEDETRLANGVKDFLRFDVLQLADPATQRQDGKLPFDADVKLRDVVLRAAKAIDGKFADRPPVEAELRWTLGYTLAGMGRHDVAAAQYERMRAIYAATVGADHPDALNNLTSLARCYDILGRRKDALAVREEAVGRMRRALGEDHLTTLASLHDLAVSYSALGRAAEGLTLAEEALARQQRTLGPDHPETLVGMLSLAKNYTATNRLADALAQREAALPLLKRVLGPDHPDTLRAVHDLAVSYARQERYREAQAMFEEEFELSRRTQGGDHPITLLTMANLAQCYHLLGRHADALAMREETLARRTARFGEGHPDALLSAQQVIESLVAVGRTDDAWSRIDATLERAARAEAQGRTLRVTLKPDLLAARLRVCRERKDAAGVRRTAELLQALPKQTADVLYAIAGCHAVLAGLATDGPAGATADADRAMAWLTKAVAAGYTNRASMEKDSVLEALRGREDFRTLIGSLRSNAPKS